MCEIVNQNRSEFDIDIGRANYGSNHNGNTEIGEPGWLGNPFPESEWGRESCIKMFRRGFEKRLHEEPAFRDAVKALDGKTLGCYCKPKACHGDVIVEWVERLNE